MPEEYFDLAYINFDKAILHGRITAGRDAEGCHTEAYIEQVLTDNQREKVGRLGARHSDEMQKLLSSFVERPALASQPGTEGQSL